MMKQRLLKFLGKVFNRKESPEANPVVKLDKYVHKDIQEMKNLQAELVAIETGFNKAIAEKESQYDVAATKYNEAYVSFTELFQRHKLRLVSEAEVNTEKEKLKPLQEAVRDIGADLDTIRKYKQDEALSLLNQMNDLQDDYLKAKAAEMNAIASELEYMKQQYQQKLSVYVTGCSEVFELESVIAYQLQQIGFNNKPVMGDKFSVLIGKPPVPFG